MSDHFGTLCIKGLTQYIHFYSISCLNDQGFHFYSIYVICLISHKIDMQKMWWEYFKLRVCKIRNYLSKTKELDQIVLQKWLFTRTILFDKGAITQFRQTGGGWIPPNWKLLLISFISKKNIFSSKRALLTKCPIPGHFICVKYALIL